MSRDFARFAEPDWELPPEHTCDECGEALNSGDRYFDYCGGNYCSSCGEDLKEKDSDFMEWATSKLWEC